MADFNADKPFDFERGFTIDVEPRFFARLV